MLLDLVSVSCNTRLFSGNVCLHSCSFSFLCSSILFLLFLLMDGLDPTVNVKFIMATKELLFYSLLDLIGKLNFPCLTEGKSNLFFMYVLYVCIYVFIYVGMPLFVYIMWSSSFISMLTYCFCSVPVPMCKAWPICKGITLVFCCFPLVLVFHVVHYYLKTDFIWVKC